MATARRKLALYTPPSTRFGERENACVAIAYLVEIGLEARSVGTARVDEPSTWVVCTEPNADDTRSCFLCEILASDFDASPCKFLYKVLSLQT